MFNLNIKYKLMLHIFSAAIVSLQKFDTNFLHDTLMLLVNSRHVPVSA